MELDYTSARKGIKTMLYVQGISPSAIDEKYNLYFDETGNVKKYIIRKNCFNVDADTNFVLGGIESREIITLDELKERLKIQPTTNEIKSKHIYNGAFECCLKSSKLENFIDFIKEKGCHIHFLSLNLTYWSIVDILDSIENIDLFQINYLKAMLYRVIKSDIRSAIDIFNKYSYPDLKNSKDVSDFMNNIKKLCYAYSVQCPKHLKETLALLVENLEKGSLQPEAIFIQNEEKSVLVKNFREFYTQQIYTFINSNITFDKENDIMRYLNNTQFIIDGKILSNYEFVDSKSNVMIQISDIVVGIIAKYLHTIDLTTEQISHYISQFDENQLRRFQKLNNLINYSLEYNPTFVHQITSIELSNLFIKLVKQYGAEH